MATAWECRKEIFAMADADAEVKRFARVANPQQNEARFRVWFWSKACFPGSCLALLPTYHRIGKWDRGDPKHANTKFGRAATGVGKHYVSSMNSAQEQQKILDAYERHKSLGRSLARVYDQAMVKAYGCIRQWDENHKAFLVQPEGERFPTYFQFRYRVYKALGKTRVQRDLLGDCGHRSRKAHSKGRYSAECAHLAEEVAFDAAQTKEMPVGLDPSIELPALWTAKGVCKASGLVICVGFGLSSERSGSYQAALFCAAIGGVAFCRLFGLPIEEEDWPRVGLPGRYWADRGPGSGAGHSAAVDGGTPIRSLVPSYSPQSNSTVEGVHPKSVKIQGTPSHVVSQATPYHLVKRALLRTIAYNTTADVSDRLTPEMQAEGVPGTPLGIHGFMARRGRTLGQTLEFAQAVRQFLTKVEFKFDDGAVLLHGRRFRSKALSDWLLANPDPYLIQGYVLDLAVRFAWIELGGRLVEVEVQMALRTNEDTWYLSLAELEQLATIVKRRATEKRWEDRAHRVHYERRSLEETGGFLDSGRRVQGHAKPRKAEAQQAATEWQTVPRRATR